MARELDLTDERKVQLQTDGTDRFGAVLSALDEAEKLHEDVEWRTQLVDGVTVEEVIGALVEAEGERERLRELTE